MQLVHKRANLVWWNLLSRFLLRGEEGKEEEKESHTCSDSTTFSNRMIGKALGISEALVRRLLKPNQSTRTNPYVAPGAPGYGQRTQSSTVARRE